MSSHIHVYSHDQNLKAYLEDECLARACQGKGLTPEMGFASVECLLPTFPLPAPSTDISAAAQLPHSFFQQLDQVPVLPDTPQAPYSNPAQLAPCYRS